MQPSATSTWSPTPVDSDTPVPTVTPQGASPYQGQVVINEVLSNPQNVDWDLMGVPRNAQWMELYNTTGSAISVEFWMVRAGDGGMGRATLGNGSSFVIPGQGYLVLYASTLGFELRQNPIALLDTSGAVVDSVSAPSLPGDQSYARRPDDPSSWMVTNNPTLAGPNSYSIQPAGTPDLQATVYAIQTEVAIPLPSPPVAPVFDDDSADASDAAVPARRRRKRSRKGQPFQTLSIAEVRKLPDDTPVITSGVITMPTGLWDLSRAYIQSNGAGLLIHSYGAQRLRLGDTLTIRGRVHHVHGEVEVAAVKGGEQIQPSGVLPAPRPVQPSQVGFGTEALLVQVVGRAEHTQRDYATIADDMGSAHLFLYSRLKFDASTLSGVSLVTITGVVNAEDTRADSGQPDAGGYAQRLLIPTHRLLPRSTADVVMGAAPPGSSTGHVSSPGAVASSSAEASGGSSSFEPRASGSAAMPTPFITPVFSSREPGLANPQTDASNAAVLSLDVPAESGRPWWQWALPALGVALLGAGTAVAFGPRWRNARAAKKEPAEAD